MAANEPESENRINLRDTFRALRHRNYRLFFAGQGVSLIGTWIESVATGWLVYQLTGSELLLGVVSFCGQIATFLLAPFAGVIVDRRNKLRMLFVTQTLFMSESFILAALVLTHMIQVWHVIVLSVFLGLINSFDMPTRQAFVISMIEDRNDLSNAIALNSTMFNSARMVGPAVAGLLIAAVGTGWCFLINGVSFIAVLGALAAMSVQEQAPNHAPGPNIFTELKEGFTYTFGFPPIRSIILLLGLVSLLSMPYAVLLPVFATKILHGGANTLGFLSSSAGVGALIGAVLLASRRTVLGLGRWIPLAAGILGAALIGLGLSHMMWLSMLMLVAVGFGMITQMACCNTILQTIVSDEMRGRVMSFYTAAFVGMSPFGSLLGGALASRIGAPHTVMIGGTIIIVGALLFAMHLPELRRLVRPIYCEKGVMPAYLCAVETVSEGTVPPEQR